MELQKLGVIEAAAAIRERAMQDLSMRASPEQVHGIKFAKDVAHELGMEPTPENVHHVIMLLREHGIALHEGHEYPKWVSRGYDGARMVANDEQMEKEIVEAKAPPPIEFVGQTINPTIQDGPSDISGQVPHISPGEHAQMRDALLRDQIHPGTRQPSDLRDMVPRDDGSKAFIAATTDREAAQDQHPLPDTEEDFVADEDVTVVDDDSGIGTTSDKGVFADNDPDRDGVTGQDEDPTHDQRAPTTAKMPPGPAWGKEEKPAAKPSYQSVRPPAKK